jgi:probable rRNA maturation factor
LSNYQQRKISFKNSNILIQNFHPALKLPVSRRLISAIVSLVFKSENAKLNALDINLVNDKKIREINRKYLNHDYSTDIITFPYNNGEKQIEGEMFISLDMVKNNSAIYSTLYTQELKRVIIHGCLHLAGYNDRTNKEKELIRKKENFYLGVKK